MSQENVDLVRQIFERWNAGEREIDAEIADPDLVVHSAMTNAAYHGYDGLQRWMAEIDDQFESWHLSIDQFRDVAEGRLLAAWDGARPWPCQRSGVRPTMARLLTFAGEKLIELRTIPDHAQALEAAGLSE